jgi:hypothetical protein
MATPQDNNNNALFIVCCIENTTYHSIAEIKQRWPESSFGWGAGIFFVKNPPDVAVNESR